MTSKELAGYCESAEEFDESGDCRFLRYIVESTVVEEVTKQEILTDFLIWACGADWQQVIDKQNQELLEDK